ncbi:MAG: LysM peptidoglycan-binding domain-containing protein, partial [Clostridia bacterium]|nr:LysM peptidoglycan-binding domain-containing protein [Clostridia bacterium]
LYIMGCFGAPMTASNKARYTKNHSYNQNATRTAMINAASSDTFGFDCVCLIKGILWGWSGKLNTNYGGASYASNGVPDFGSDAISAYVNNQRSTDWSNIEIGEAVWMSGHIGVYIGNGLAVECTPKWANDVQITAVGGIGTVAGYNTRNWTAHGKLRYVTYTGSNDNPHTNGSSTLSLRSASASYVTYTVQSGDSLSSIGAKYGLDYTVIAEYNGIASPYTIHVGQVLKIPV